MTTDVEHALQKVRDNANELQKLDPAAPRALHCVFQLSYNIGRLSELSGLGRKVYDGVRPFVDRGDWDFVVEELEELLA